MTCPHCIAMMIAVAPVVFVASFSVAFVVTRAAVFHALLSALIGDRGPK